MRTIVLGLCALLGGCHPLVTVVCSPRAGREDAHTEFMSKCAADMSQGPLTCQARSQDLGLATCEWMNWRQR